MRVSFFFSSASLGLTNFRVLVFAVCAAGAWAESEVTMANEAMRPAVKAMDLYVI
jgi:hypothetical protein